MRTDNDPSAQLGEAVSAALFQNSHYGIPTIGWAHEMAKLDRDDAIAFYDRYYTPNNAIVVVAGDVTEDEVRKLAEATYGKVPRRAEPRPRERATEPPPLAARTVTLADPRVTQPSLQRSYLAPSYVTGETGEAEALDVLARDSRRRHHQSALSRARRRQAVAARPEPTIAAPRSATRASASSAAPRGDTTLEALAGDIDTVVAEIADNGVTEDELVRAKRRINADAVYAQDDHSKLARVFGQALSIGQTVADVAELARRDRCGHGRRRDQGGAANISNFAAR